MAFITLVEKMDAVTIQNRPLLDALRRCLAIPIILKSIVVPIK